MSMMSGQLDGVVRRFQSLTRREQILIGAMTGTAVLLLVAVVVILVGGKISALEDRIEQNDQVLLELAMDGERLLEIRNEREKEESRFERDLPPLPGLLERLAGEAGIEIPESRELSDDIIDKKWQRKSVEVRLRRVGLRAFTDFMVKIENENRRMPLAITHLSIKKRPGEPDSYDVDITVSAYHKIGSEKKGKKTDDKKAAKEKKAAADRKGQGTSSTAAAGDEEAILEGTPQPGGAVDQDRMIGPAE